MPFQSDVFQVDAFVTGGNPGAAPNPGISGATPGDTEAISGYAISGATRSGDYGAWTNRLIVQIGGREFIDSALGLNTPIRSLIWAGTINLTDASNAQSDSGSFSTHSGYKPAVGQTCLIGVGTIGGGREFGGRVQAVNDNEFQQNVFDVNLIDWIPDLDKNKVFGHWQSLGADIIFRDILTDFCPGFSAVGVTRDAPSIPEVNASGENASAIFQQIADYLGWEWNCDAWKDVSLGPATDSQAAPVVTGALHFDNLKWREDLAQVRTVVWGIGGGGAIAATYDTAYPAPIVLPMDSVSKYRVGQWVIVGTHLAEVLACDVPTKALTISTWFNQPVLGSPTYSGQTDATFQQGTQVNIVVRRENPIAIARMAILLTEAAGGVAHDGRIEHVVSDGSRNEDGIIALADANLARFSYQSMSGTYSTWNKARSGNFVQVTYPQRKLWGDFHIQDVHTVMHVAPDYIQRAVTFTDTLLMRFTDLLRAAARSRKDE